MTAAEIAAAIADHVRERTDIVAVYLFGSHALGTARAGSDVDVAVLFAPTVADTWQAQFGLEAALSRLPGLAAIEVVALNHAPLRLQAEVLQTGLRVWCGDQEARAAYEFDAMRRWWDLLPWRAAYDREFFAELKKNFTDDQRRAYQRARQTLAPAD